MSPQFSLPSGLLQFAVGSMLMPFSVSAYPVNTTTPTICRQLSNSLPGKVLLPNSTLYTESTQSYFFRNSIQDPACVIVPTSAKDVSLAIKAIAVEPSVKFSVKSGGHSPNKGASSTDGGIVFDLNSMKSIVPLNGKWDIVDVGAGAKSVDAYRALDPYNRTVVGGRVASVGLGGALTGGALGFSSPQHGWGCDAIVNVEVVLASGDIVNANATSHSDLFRALKGGQNNFGVVTRFFLKTFPQGPFWGGAIQYPQEADEAQLNAFAEFKTVENYDPKTASVEQSFIYYGQFGSFFSSNTIFDSQPVVNASGLKYFTAIQPQQGNTMRVSNTTDFATELELLQPFDQYAIYSTTTIKVSSTILHKIHDLWKTTTTELASVTNLTSVLTFQSIPPPPPASNPNSLGFAAGSTPHKDSAIALLSIYWPLETDAPKVTVAIEALQRSIEQAAQAEGALNPFTYINYATTMWQEDAMASYGEQEVQRMKAVAEKYDPGRVFQIQAPGGFKLPQ